MSVFVSGDEIQFILKVQLSANPTRKRAFLIVPSDTRPRWRRKLQPVFASSEQTHYWSEWWGAGKLNDCQRSSLPQSPNALIYDVCLACHAAKGNVADCVHSARLLKFFIYSSTSTWETSSSLQLARLRIK